MVAYHELYVHKQHKNNKRRFMACMIKIKLALICVQLNNSEFRYYMIKS